MANAEGAQDRATLRQGSAGMDYVDAAVRYHQTTKHHFSRLSRSLGYLDWDTQPDPFRRFRGAPLVELPLGHDSDSPSFDELSVPGAVTGERVCLPSIAAFLELSLGLSAWKELGGSRWALRINPSSGNLHPTEGYLVAGAVDGLCSGPSVFHYAPKEHALERRTRFDQDLWERLSAGFPDGMFFAGLSSVHWREAWKYGERAYRYCQHDVGHALAALAYSAAVRGWTLHPLAGLGDDDVAKLLGLDRAEDFEGAELEHPDLLVAVVPADHGHAVPWPGCLEADAVARVASGVWTGAANALSKDHVDWKIIDEVAQACVKPGLPTSCGAVRRNQSIRPIATDRPCPPAARIIRQRRSAVEMDGRTGITAGQFYLMLDRTLPRFDRVPFCALGPPACVHLGLFVHLVEGLPPGLYCLARSASEPRPSARADSGPTGPLVSDAAPFTHLQESMRPDFLWKTPPGCPESLPLFLLAEGDVRSVAWRVSCDQHIAAAGAFSLGMIAEFDGPLKRHGAWFYRRLFWETGMIGQVLYLEAEAAGLRATGIGCFYDDPVHEVFGLGDTVYQSLYHFTVGGPLDDARLTTLPPYPRREPQKPR